jgi:receptor protein-tyrosine kinase
VNTVAKLKEDPLLDSEIHKLAARLWRRARRENMKVLLVTSAARGEGKSTTVAYLATALALHPGRRILAIDLDFREPKLNSHFGVEAPHGLGEVIRGRCAIEEAIVPTGLATLQLLLPPADGEDHKLLLRTEDLERTFDLLRQAYDLVLLDAPALIPVADTSSLIPLVDGVLLMAMAGKTTRHQLKKAREICVGLDANILGLVVGNLQEAMPEYGSLGYGYGYSIRGDAGLGG